jgi:hypothetical protein
VGQTEVRATTTTSRLNSGGERFGIRHPSRGPSSHARCQPKPGQTHTLLVVGVLVLLAYAVGTSWTPREGSHLAVEDPFPSLGEQIQQAYCDEPGNPRMH